MKSCIVRSWSSFSEQAVRPRRAPIRPAPIRPALSRHPEGRRSPADQDQPRLTGRIAESLLRVLRGVEDSLAISSGHLFGGPSALGGAAGLLARCMGGPLPGSIGGAGGPLASRISGVRGFSGLLGRRLFLARRFAVFATSPAASAVRSRAASAAERAFLARLAADLAPFLARFFAVVAAASTASAAGRPASDARSASRCTCGCAVSTASPMASRARSAADVTTGRIDSSSSLSSSTTPVSTGFALRARRFDVRSAFADEARTVARRDRPSMTKPTNPPAAAPWTAPLPAALVSEGWSALSVCWRDA